MVCHIIVVAAALAIGILPGCGGQAKPYPEAKVTTQIGKSGECAFCKKKIDDIKKNNLATIQGIRYILCDEKCAAGMKEWVKHQ